MTMPIIRSANFVSPDFRKAQATFANRKAKQMMGSGNPNTGAEIRKPGSGQCPTCNKWHRLGNICPNTKKSANMEALFRSHGEYATPQPQQAGMDQMEQMAVPMSDVLTQQIQEQLVAPPAPVPPTPPAAVPPAPDIQPQPVSPQGTQGLLNHQVVAPPPATPQEQQQQLQDSSTHLQGQSNDYMEALRNWQAKYGGQ
jgi:hypothetical protein